MTQERPNYNSYFCLDRKLSLGENIMTYDMVQRLVKTRKFLCTRVFHSNPILKLTIVPARIGTRGTGCTEVIGHTEVTGHTEVIGHTEVTGHISKELRWVAELGAKYNKRISQVQPRVILHPLAFLLLCLSPFTFSVHLSLVLMHFYLSGLLIANMLG